MTAELAFAKSFLSALDTKPVKLQADHAVDPDTLELKGPYTLPRMPNPMKAPEKGTAEVGSAPGVDVSLKSLRNPPLNLTLTAQPLTVSILDLKQRVASEIGATGTSSIRLLYNKKPCSDSKSIKEVVGTTDSTQVEFSVMVIGGAPKRDVETDPSPAPAAVAAGDVDAEDANAKQIMKEDAFWADLEGFLGQRVKSSRVAHDAVTAFKQAWT